MKLSEAIRRQLFEIKDYREFVKSVLDEEGQARGYRKQIADKIGCQPAYFSHVMTERAELTPEHAEKLCGFWELTDLESEYFFNLVLVGRAGTASLRERLEARLYEIKDLWESQSETFGKPSLSEHDQANLYYSHWLNSAIHLLLTVPGFQTVDALAKHLRKTPEEITHSLSQLEGAGLVKKTPTGWTPGRVQIHAAQKEFFAEIHHKNWRAQALEVKFGLFSSAMRYTSIHSLSKVDYVKIQDLTSELVQKSRQIIESSPEEMAAALVIDYFSF